MENNEKNFDRHVESEIPQNERQNWVSIALVWIGSMICVPSVLIGQQLVSGLSFALALVAGIVGYGLVLIITILQGMQAADLGRPTVVNAKPSFGSGVANYLFSIVIAVALIGWFGIQTTIAGASFQALFDIFGISIGINLASAIIGVIMVASAVFGFRAMEKLNTIAVPLLIIVLTWATINALLSTNIGDVFNYKPENSISLVTGISIVFGGFVVGAVIAGDFTRFNKNRKETVKSAGFGIVPAGFLLVFIGGYLAISSGDVNSDVISVLTSHIPFPIIAIITLILATWTTNVTNAYSSGIALVNGLRLKESYRPIVTVISGIIGIALALLGILNNFVLFLIILTNLVTPIAGVMIADYWVLNKGKKDGYMEQVASKWVGVTAWILGAIPGIIITIPALTPNFLVENITLRTIFSVIGVFISFSIYLILKGGKKWENN